MKKKFTSYFRENYKCAKLKHSSETLVNGKHVVEGSCQCKGNKSGVCSWKHTIDSKGNVVNSREHGCPCATMQIKEHSTNNGVKTGKAIAIGFSILGGVVFLIGILYIMKQRKKK